jgi:hypothetical protein
MNVPLVLDVLCNGQEWRLADMPKTAEEYDSFLEWFGQGAAPSWSDLVKAADKIEFDAACSRIEISRRAAYAETSDPLFFKFQAGEATEQEWLAARQEVVDANPYPAKTK